MSHVARFIRGTGGSPVFLWKTWASRPCHGLLAILLTCLCCLAAPTTTPTSPPFTFVDVLVDTKAPLAAYQFDFSAGPGSAIVGIEGGEHPAFANPPYYDPAAMQHERVIAAAYSLSPNLPSGKTRIARIHLQVTGKPAYQVHLVTAGGVDGKPMPAEISVREGEAP